MSSNTLPIYQVDAFTDRLFAGNPAAVCLLEQWLPDQTLQNIAAENNLSETAFLVPADNHFHIRWFTPVLEVELCGHATLASAWVIFNELSPAFDHIRFQSKSGILEVKREQRGLTMDFPADPPAPCEPPEGLLSALRVEHKEVLKGRTDYLVVISREQQVRETRPDFYSLSLVKARGVIITAPGDQVDFVSRFFAPACGINEDPVTGSAHCTLTPYWSRRLQKSTMEAQQISSRGGTLQCSLQSERVMLTGNAVLYMKGEITI